MFRVSLVRLPALVTLVAAILIGVLLSLLFHGLPSISDSLLSSRVAHSLLYKDWLWSHNVSQEQDLSAVVKTDFQEVMLSESLFLSRTARILCFLTIDIQSSFLSSQWSRERYVQQAVTAVVNTWGQRCNKLVFFSPSIRFHPAGVTVLAIKSRPINSWSAFREALIQISNSYLNDYEWFVRVDLDTYLVVENLRYYVSVFDSNQPLYFGYATNAFFSAPYNSYDAAIVLSHGTLRKLHNVIIQGHCSPRSVSGDVELGRCLSEVGINPIDTRDHLGRGRFLPYDPETHIIPGGQWFSSIWKKSGRNVLQEGSECCSDYAITFHNIDSNLMLVMDYFVYHLKPFGKSIRQPIDSLVHLLT